MTPEVFAVAQTAVRADTEAVFGTLAKQGFSLVPVPGFYPRVRAERSVHVHGLGHRALAIDFWMSLAEGGGYHAEWSRDAPFDLGGCATITRTEGAELIRYWKPYTLYSARPFNDAIGTLGTDLKVVADALESWSDNLVVSTGQRVRLPPPAESP